MPVVVNPGVLDPKDFIKAVLELRLPNPFMPDAPQRIATDTHKRFLLGMVKPLRHIGIVIALRLQILHLFH